MTQEEILEYNKRCALFLGAIDNTHEWGFMLRPNELNLSFDLFNEKLFSNDGGSGWFVKDLKFHSDWNWIMEVVEAIEKLGYQFDITGNEVGVNSNIMSMENISTGGTMNSYNRSYYPTIISICEEEYSKKEAVIQAIYQFLKWYNNENNNNR